MQYTANTYARCRSTRRNDRPPRRTRKEKEWLQKYNQRLLSRGLPLDVLLGMDPEINLDYDPADAADDELSYMADDHRLCNG